jgi:uncharacterized membrane protein HdeD (DUF308 family)
MKLSSYDVWTGLGVVCLILAVILLLSAPVLPRDTQTYMIGLIALVLGFFMMQHANVVHLRREVEDLKKQLGPSPWDAKPQNPASGKKR